jgi:hypothetical protein
MMRVVVPSGGGGESSLSLKKKKKKMRRRTPEFISFDRLRFDLFKQVYYLILKP